MLVGRLEKLNYLMPWRGDGGMNSNLSDLFPMLFPYFLLAGNKRVRVG